MDEKKFADLFEHAYEQQAPNFDKHINVAIVGKVSAGKSSLLNAILGRDRSDPVAKVGAHSGVTTKITPYKLDNHVLIIDCPGLADVHEENSIETKEFLASIDLGLFVISGSADTLQKAGYEELKCNSKKIIVILNKIDDWDDYEESAYESVVKQWRLALGVDKIFGTCVKGYDPKMRPKMDIRGIEEVRKEIFDFLEGEGKAILLARHLKDKEKYAIGIIAGAIIAVAGEAFVPGSAIYITVTQALSIASLHYLYTGEVLSGTGAAGIVMSFSAQSVGMNLFIWVKSFLPPTGIVDVAAAGVAVVITFAMLAAVKWVLENNYGIERKDLLKKAFGEFKTVGAELKKISIEDLKNKESIMDLIMRLLSMAR